MKKDLPLRAVAEVAEVDISLLSKIERNERLASADTIPGLAKALGIPETDLKVKYYSSKFFNELKDEKHPNEVLKSVIKEFKRVKV